MEELIRDLREKAIKDLKKLNEKPEFSPNEWSNAKTVLSALCKMKELEHGSEEGSSYKKYSMPRISYDDGYSEKRGRSQRTGRYVSMGNEPYYDDYSFERGTSGHSITDRMVAQIERMYDMAKTDHERRELDKWIDRIQNGD